MTPAAQVNFPDYLILRFTDSAKIKVYPVERPAFGQAGEPVMLSTGLAAVSAIFEGIRGTDTSASGPRTRW